MRKKLLFIVCLLLVVLLTACGDQEPQREISPSEYETIFNEAYEVGYNKGYSDGYKEGISNKPEENTRVLPADPVQKSSDVTYVLNTNTKKFHYPTCPSVDQMKDKNKKYFSGTRDEVIDMGYEPCGRCKP